MKGLVLKDLISLRRQGKLLIGLLVLYAVMATVQKSMGFLSGMTAMFCIILPITAMAYDEAAKWDQYALAMPLSRSKLVLSRYLLGLLAGITGTVFSTVVGLCFLLPQQATTLEDLLITGGAMLGVSLLLLSLILPILHQFGVQKGRLVMILVICLAGLIPMVLKDMSLPVPDPEILSRFAFLAPIGVIGLFVLSGWISVRIYAKKEF